MVNDLTATQQIDLEEAQEKSEGDRKRAEARGKKIKENRDAVANSEDANTNVGKLTLQNAELLEFAHSDIKDTKREVRKVRVEVKKSINRISTGMQELTLAVKDNKKNGMVRIPRKDKEPVEVPSWLLATIVGMILLFLGALTMTGHLSSLVNAYKEVKAVRDGTASKRGSVTNEVAFVSQP